MLHVFPAGVVFLSQHHIQQKVRSEDGRIRLMWDAEVERNGIRNLCNGSKACLAGAADGQACPAAFLKVTKGAGID